MLIPLILLFTSMFVWLFPPFKNRKTEYFLFFLLLALLDPVKMTLNYFFKLPFLPFTLLFAQLLLASLIRKKIVQIILLIISPLVVAAVMISNASTAGYEVLSIIFHFSVMMVISIHFFNYLVTHKSINLFLVLLLCYESIMFFRRILIFMDPGLGQFGFIIGGGFQILFGIAFIFINIDTRNYKVIKE